MKTNLLTDNRYPDRCTGRTTGMALRYIAQAMETPGVWIACADHHPGLCGAREVVRVCRRVVEALDLKFFEFNHGADGIIAKNPAIRCCHVVFS